MKDFFLSRKFLLRIFSLFAGLFIWMYVVSSSELEISKNIPIEIELPKSMAIKNDISHEVLYRLKGPALFVRKYLETQNKIVIKKEDYYQKRRSRYHIALDQFLAKLPLGVELVQTQPPQLTLVLERARKKRVSIKPVFASHISEKYKLKNLKAFPATVLVSGPSSLINNLKFIETKLIEDIDTNKGTSFLVDLALPDSRITLKDSQVNVTYTLQSRNIEFTYNEIPIIFQSTRLIKSATPKMVKIIVKGEESKLKSLGRDSIQIVALVPKNKRGKLDVELIVELPEGISLVSLTPKTVKLELENL
ncbi:MAG: YbbR-like domain-containing protein [Halobacteriovoraceae bacterium]|jgi:YbbR domain-containing protein|nr:YbbR-like domain-containing protein [Halobacteriovoraceae bacterium]